MLSSKSPEKTRFERCTELNELTGWLKKLTLKVEELQKESTGKAVDTLIVNKCRILSAVSSNASDAISWYNALGESTNSDIINRALLLTKLFSVFSDMSENNLQLLAKPRTGYKKALNDYAFWGNESSAKSHEIVQNILSALKKNLLQNIEAMRTKSRYTTQNLPDKDIQSLAQCVRPAALKEKSLDKNQIYFYATKSKFRALYFDANENRCVLELNVDLNSLVAWRQLSDGQKKDKELLLLADFFIQLTKKHTNSDKKVDIQQNEPSEPSESSPGMLCS